VAAAASYAGGFVEHAELREKLVGEYAEAAALEHRLRVAESRVAISMAKTARFETEKVFLESEVHCERTHAASLGRSLAHEEAAAMAANGEAVALRAELGQLSRSSDTLRRVVPTLRTNAGAAEEVAQSLVEEFAVLQHQHRYLEIRCSATREEAAAERAVARQLRQQLSNEGRDLALLRCSASGYVEDLRGSAEQLDEQIKRTCVEPTGRTTSDRALQR
jgi:chromosome segregation ATPase